MKIKIIIAVLILVSAGGYFFLQSGFKKTPGRTGYSYKSSEISRGPITEKVTGTGILQAVGTVRILALMSGTVEKVYTDYNSAVKKGTPLLAFDKQLLQISEKEAKAAVLKARVQYEEEKRKFDINENLFKQNYISENDYKSSRASLDISQAGLIMAEAAWEKIRINLEQNAVILSPVNGIVLARNVDEGDSVVSGGSSQTELFVLAENLKTMEIKADVDELDISRIREGMDVNFTVEAWPERIFTGRVKQLRKIPASVNNIVTYTVIISADNKDELLLPGMTATTEFIIAKKNGALLVPNQALRFSPPAEAAEAARKKLLDDFLADKNPEERERILKSLAGGQSGRDTQNRPTQPQPLIGGQTQPMRFSSQNDSQLKAERDFLRLLGGGRSIYIVEPDGTLSMKLVQTGISDGIKTELLNSAALEGLKAATGLER